VQHRRHNEPDIRLTLLCEPANTRMIIIVYWK